MTQTFLKLVQNAPQERTCKVCDVSKPVAEFKRFQNTYTSKTCNPCFAGKERVRQRALWAGNPQYRERHGAKGKEYWAKKPDQRKKIKDKPHYLKKRYGITYADALRTLDAQNQLCANRGCGIEISFDAVRGSKNRAVIDHCHATGKFRAILCNGCNLLLGRIETKTNILLGLVEYQSKHKLRT